MAVERGATTPAQEEAAPAASGAGKVVVFIVSRDTQCAECARQIEAGGLISLEEKKALCLECALLDELEFLPSGNVAMTRRATRHSRVAAVVLKWSRRRKRYERQGTLVEAEAIRRAEVECAADAATRGLQRERAAARREIEEREYVAAFVRAVGEQFPGCPMSEAREIAAHACAKYSGRIGRTGAAKDLDPQAVRLAVIAHVRHLHTDYERIIAATGDKRESRTRIKDAVSAVLRAWEQGVPAEDALAGHNTPAA